MALNYGYNNLNKNEPNAKTTQYTLKYQKTALNVAMYSVRSITSGGYKYITAHGLTSNSAITLLTHSFSTSTGNNMDGGTIAYSFEFLNKNGTFSYFNIDKLNIKPLKIPKSGSKYNMFFLNKTYLFSEIMGAADLSNYAMFSVFITQESGPLSNDTSELELIITF